MKYKIPFNKPFIAGKELYYIAQSVLSGHSSGDGPYTKKCEKMMEEIFSAKKILLTTSCTSALEMAALLCDIEEGDEVILPSYTFVSTANAFLLRGAKPVFVDIRPDTMNMNEKIIEKVVTNKTKAIVPVHYAGVSVDMDPIRSLADKYGLYIIEDAAQGVGAKYKESYLGTIGDFGTFSFHETKNFSCGEGGALLVNNPELIERAEIIREKGTNRSKFFRGEVDKYTWVDVGSSYIPSDLLAAFLYAQLENMELISQKRLEIYNLYLKQLQPLADQGFLVLPSIPDTCTSNSHMFYIVLESLEKRSALIDYLKQKDILAVFHYVPLHLSPVGKKFGYREGSLPVTEDLSDRLLRLPFYYELEEYDVSCITKEIFSFFR